MKLANEIIEEMTSLFDEIQSKNLCRFFKTGKGEYGEGDKFLGIRVPITRSIVKKYKNKITLSDIKILIESDWHEIRLAGFLFLLEIYKTSIKNKDFVQSKTLVNFYLNNLDKGNNWDLVDLVAGYILGDWILRNLEDEKILFKLADKDGKLWHQRVAVVSTFSLIKAEKYDSTFLIAEKFLDHQHDLIHKATGWMLREIGKRGGKIQLIEFLKRHRKEMPRTMLRYAIEKFPEKEKQYFMGK